MSCFALTPTLLVGVFYNLALRDKYFGFEPHHRLVWAGDLLVSADTDKVAAEKVWQWAQRADGLNVTHGVSPVDASSAPPTGDAWLDAREMPSLSVGDVLLIGPQNRGTTGRWFAVAPTGFTQLDPAPGDVSWQNARRAMDEAETAAR